MEDLQSQNRELLNRIQAKDLHAFATLQAQTQQPTFETDSYMPRSDEAEAHILYEQYGNLEGVGDLVYSEEEIGFLNDLGIDLSEAVND